jgi:hypothetical protein
MLKLLECWAAFRGRQKFICDNAAIVPTLLSEKNGSDCD